MQSRVVARLTAPIVAVSGLLIVIALGAAWYVRDAQRNVSVMLGSHVASMRAALGAKNGPARIHLVTDAMSTVGSDIQSFMLNGREIRRDHGRLTLADGTLAGADIDMISCVRFAHQTLGLSKTEALRMAGLYPAQCIGREAELGVLRAGSRADFVCILDSFEVSETYIGGLC